MSSVSIGVEKSITRNICVITHDDFFATIVFNWYWSNNPFNFNNMSFTIDTYFLASPIIINNRCFVNLICIGTRSENSREKTCWYLIEYLHGSSVVHWYRIWCQWAEKIRTGSLKFWHWIISWKTWKSPTIQQHFCLSRRRKLPLLVYQYNPWPEKITSKFLSKFLILTRFPFSSNWTRRCYVQN